MERRLTELSMYLAALLWGIWMLLPQDTFASSPATWQIVADIAPEWAWGLAMIVSSAVGIIGVYSRHVRRRRVALAALACLWFAIWLCFVMSNWRSTGVITYLWFVILYAISYLKAGTNGVHR